MRTTHGFEVERVGQRTSPTGADQVIWSVTPAVNWGGTWEGSKSGTADFVLTSAIDAMFSGWETYIFPCDKDGEVVDWGELPGSFRGPPNHEAAIMNLNHDREE